MVESELSRGVSRALPRFPQGGDAPCLPATTFIRPTPRVLETAPFSRLVSLCGFQRYGLRFEEHFLNGSPGPGRATVLTATGPGFEIRSDKVVHDGDPRVARAFAAHQVIEVIERKGYGRALPPHVFGVRSQPHRLRQLCREANLEAPRFETLSTERPTTPNVVAQCFITLDGRTLQTSGLGYSVREAFRAASQKMLDKPETRGKLHPRPVDDATTTLVGALLRGRYPRPEFLLHYIPHPVVAAAVLELPGREPLKFLGHADTVRNAEAVAANRAATFLLNRLRTQQRGPTRVHRANEL